MRRSRRRKLWIALVVLLIAAAIALLAYLRHRSPPEAVRLLPEGDAVLHVNLHLMRLGRAFEHASPVAHDPDYEQFVNATGFQFERDLDQAAFAVHAYGSPLNPGSGGPGSFTDTARFSEIFVGRFDSARVSAWLRQMANAVEQYRGLQIYAIPHEGRTVRVSILGIDTVAVSNVQDVAVIHQMIDRYRTAAVPVGPALVRENYRRVPLGSVAWAIAKFSPSQQPTLAMPGGFELAAQWLAGSVLVGSARYVGSIHLRIEDFAGSEQRARAMLEGAQAFLGIFRSVEVAVQAGGADPDVKALFDSIKLEQRGASVTLTATVPKGFITKVLSGTPPAEGPPEPSPVAPAPKRHGTTKK